MQKTFTTNLWVEDVGDVDNPEDARTFLKALETWPYPLEYTGLRFARYGKGGAIDMFKSYAGIY
jgi:hypothetical protein